jgi:hypothetical protein
MVAFGEWSFGEWSPSGIGRSEIGRSENGRSGIGRSGNGRCTVLICAYIYRVAEHIFTNYIQKMLKNKTVILVTHGLQVSL